MRERPRDESSWLRALGAAEPCAGAQRRRWTFAVLALASLTAGLDGLLADVTSWRLRYPDALDYAQMGRQLAEGRGLTSLQAFPYVLGWLHEHGLATTPPWPIAWRFPLPVVTRAAAIAALGPSDFAALLPALLYSILAAPLLFRLGNRLGGPLAGLLPALLWIASPSQRELAATGLTEPGAALLAVAIAGAALRARDAEAAQAPAVLGGLLGLAVLQRTNLLALAPVAIVLALAAPGARARRAACIAGTAALVCAPWWLRNALVLGDPLLNLTSDRGLLRLGLGRDPFYDLSIPDRAAVLRASLAAYPAGWSADWLARSLGSMLGRDFAWLLPAAALATIADWRTSRRGLWLLAWSGLLATAVVFVPPYPDVLRFYWPTTPLLLAGVCASGLALARRARHPGASFAVAAGGFVAFVGFAWAVPNGPAAPLLAARPIPRFAWPAGAPALDGIVASDASQRVAWDARLPSVRFTGSWPVLSAIDARIGRIGAVHLSPANVRAAAALTRPPLSRLFAPMPIDRGALYVRRPAASGAEAGSLEATP